MSDVHLILPFAHHLISVDVTGVVKTWVIRQQGLVCLRFISFMLTMCFKRTSVAVLNGYVEHWSVAEVN